MKVPPTATETFCEWCVEHPSRPCPACNARRRRAVRLVEGDGLPIDEAARQMRLPVPRVERLLEEEADRRTLARVPPDARRERAAARAVPRAAAAPTRRLTAAELGRRVGTSAIQVERWLGLQPTAPKTDGRGRTYPGRILTTISVENAGRLARAMGYAPCEIDGC